MLRSRVVLLLFAVFWLPGCANCKDKGPGDGQDAGMMTPINPGPGMGGPCGALGEACCLGAGCDENLRCGSNSRCCSVPRGLACADSSDCCPGLSCVNSECLADRGAACLGSSDCNDNLACEQGICGGPPPDCGNEALPCCVETTPEGDTRYYCISGLVCPDMTDCVPCGAMGDACCDGEIACPGTVDPDTGDPIQQNLVCFEGQCQVPLACGDIVGDPCCGDACALGLLCNPDTGICDEDPDPPGVGPGPAPMPGIDAGMGGDGDGGVDGGVVSCGRAGEACCPGADCLEPGTCCVDDMCLTPEECKRRDEEEGGDGECGEEGNRCCLPALNCVAGLTCDLISFEGIARCRACTPSGSSCGSGSIGFGFGGQRDDRGCCGVSTCVPGGAYGSRCSAIPGLPCNPLSGGLGCVGEAVCEGFFCGCQEEGEDCQSPGLDCCGGVGGIFLGRGARCVGGRCRSCPGVDARCSRPSECCSQLTCDTSQGRCCVGQGGACRSTPQCCGVLECLGDRCQPNRDGTCFLPSDCGPDEVCAGANPDASPPTPGVCDRTGGLPAGTDCTSPSECRGLSCLPDAPPPDRRTQCCVPAGGSLPCENNADCCGTSTCVPFLSTGELRCDYVAMGADCATSTECPPGFRCNGATFTCTPI